MYLAKLSEIRVESGIYNPWEHVISIIESYGGKMRYPSKDAEYNLIYNRIRGYIPTNFTLDLRPDIRHFVTSLLLLYEQRKNDSFYCGALGLLKNFRSSDSKEDPLLLTSIWLEIAKGQMDEGLPFSRLVKQCLREQRKFSRHLTRLTLYQQAYTKKMRKLRNLASRHMAILDWIQKHLLHLMRMRHKEIFGVFACAKSLTYRFQPLLNRKKLKILIQQYEETPPLSLYLNLICNDFRHAFDILHPVRKGGLSRFEHLFGYPDFVHERIKFVTGSTMIFDWPLDFFVKLFFGHFRRYDYVNTLQVGIEQVTSGVPLYTDKQKRGLQTFR